MPGKTQQTLKGDEIEVKLESDGGKDRVFKLTHKALEERKDDQQLWRAIRTRQRDKERERKNHEKLKEPIKERKKERKPC